MSLIRCLYLKKVQKCAIMGRKKSLGKKYTNLEKTVVDYLENKGVSDITDFVLVDELIFNVYMADQAKSEIQEYGILVNIRADPSKEPLLQTNQAVSTYNNAVKNIQTLCTKLGLTVQERTKLKLAEADVDEIDKILTQHLS